VVYVKETEASLEEVGRRLEAAAEKQQFGVLAVHNLRETMKKKGVDLAFDCLVYEVCNPEQAKRALETDVSVSTLLPCRISVYRQGAATKIATFLPSALFVALEAANLEPVAREVERALVQMIDEAAG
jgi:uncharacterized protein (DUF302 family)